MSPELETRVENSALECLPRITSSVFGIVAAGFEDPYNTLFGRDSQEAARRITPKCPPFIPYAILSQQVLVEHMGTKSDSTTGEEEDKLPHEYHDEYSPQERLIHLENNSELPIQTDRNGKRHLLIYASVDVNPKFRRAARSIARALEIYVDSAEAQSYRRWVFPYLEATYEHDRRHLDSDGMIVAEPKVGFTNTNWKDSPDAYISETGKIPKPPYKYLNVNCELLDSHLAMAEIAEALGYNKMASDLRENFQKGVETIHRLFWDQKVSFFAPLIAGDDRPVMFIGDDVLEGLEIGIYRPTHAKAVLNRLRQPDMLTDWGIFTRSSHSTQWERPDDEGYHRKTVWDLRTAMLREGAIRYRDYRLARDADNRSARFEIEEGMKELISVTADGTTKSQYREKNGQTSCKSLAFTIAGRIGSGFSRSPVYPLLEPLEVSLLPN